MEVTLGSGVEKKKKGEEDEKGNQRAERSLQKSRGSVPLFSVFFRLPGF